MEKPKFTIPPFVTVGMMTRVSTLMAALIAGAAEYERQIIEIRMITNASEAAIRAAADAHPDGLIGVRAQALRGEWPPALPIDKL